MVDFIAEYTENERLKEAMLYSIHAWQTITPAISVNNSGRFSKRDGNTRLSSGSLEMIHTYSLIHDDLPQWTMMIYVVANQPIIKCLVKRLPF